ncbi:MAG: DUF6508 domain-containing protein [Chloroflexi bacterium]|nr:DUF6508 domain-containing protein [Chloroflexota bacterium]
MTTSPPTVSDIDELLAFLPLLYAPGFRPIKRWSGGENTSGRAITMPWPEYSDVVQAFFRLAAKDCWTKYDYVPEQASTMLMDEHIVRSATLDQIKTMLTFCVRGERFSDGHFGAMLETGRIRALLERLQELRRQQEATDGVSLPPPDLFVREDVSKPENRVNLALFSLMLVPQFRHRFLRELGLDVDSIVYPPRNVPGGRPDFVVIGSPFCQYGLRHLGS